MQLYYFVLEHTLVNTVAIFPAAIAIAFIGGPFLIGLGANKWIRMIIYSSVGAASGLVTYSYLTIPSRPLEFMEGLYLFIGMLNYALIPTVIGVLIASWMRHRKEKSLSKPTS